MSARALRPLLQAAQRRIARPAFAAGFVNHVPKTIAPSVSSQLQQLQSRKAEAPKMNILYAAMPQLVPFYFVNEVVSAFILLPTLIYLLTKYILPQEVRKRAARLFISKL